MNEKIKFLFGIHNHQPVGNFGFVFEDCFEKGYRPFIEILEKFPNMKISLHYTGALYEWIKNNRPGFFDRVLRLIESGQVEMLGGGFFEPILSIIPERDAVGQIKLNTKFLKDNFNVEPNGVWLAERIWDPYIPVILSKADIKYTIVDDTHFFYAGMSQKEMFGYYITEKHGYTTAVFPIDKFLRYSIPFKEPHETLDYIRRVKDEFGADCITFADDGEKFGIWPGTYDWVYRDRWLERFFSALEDNSDWIEMISFSEFMKIYPPKGKVSLPMASYEEMMRWSLPVDAAEKFESALEWLNNAGIKEDYKPFIRGGCWDNFLIKYPESNSLHKKMLFVSGKIENSNIDKKLKAAAKEELYRGQCNCAYWHGLFGGLYLNYLRHAIYHHLIKAEKLIDENALQKDKSKIFFLEFDYDADTNDEIIVETSLMNAYFDPSCGGTLLELDYRPKNFNITDVLSRKRELYHKSILEKIHNGHPGDDSSPKSIHDIVNLKEEGLDQIMFYDKYLKRNFMDHFLEEDVTIDRFMKNDYEELGDFVTSPYEYKLDIRRKQLTFSRAGEVLQKGIRRSVDIKKSFIFNGSSAAMSVVYEVINKSEVDLDLCFGVEFNFTLLAGDNEDRYYYFPEQGCDKRRLNSMDEIENTKSFCMRDDFNKFTISLQTVEPVFLWHFPIETVSQSESGIERTYQGSTVFLGNMVLLKPNAKKEMKLELVVKE